MPSGVVSVMASATRLTPTTAHSDRLGDRRGLCFLRNSPRSWIWSLSRVFPWSARTPDCHLASTRMRAFTVDMPTSISGPPGTRVSGMGHATPQKYLWIVCPHTGKIEKSHQVASQSFNSGLRRSRRSPEYRPRDGVLAMNGLQITVEPEAGSACLLVFARECSNLPALV